MLRSGASAPDLAERITGLDDDHPLFTNVVEVIQLRLG